MQAAGHQTSLDSSSDIDSSLVFLAQPAPSRVAADQHNVSRIFSLMPPLGLLSIAAYLEERGMTARVFDFNAEPEAQPAFLKTLSTHRPGWLGLTAVTANFNGAVALAEAAKQILPTLKVVVGGPHVSALREKILERFPVIDILIVGEGEETMHQLMQRGPDQALQVSGIVARRADHTPFFTGYPATHLELDSLPFPAYHRLTGFPDRYRLPLFSYPRAPGASIISSRGCPYACSYCDRSVFRRTFRYNSADYLYRHIRFLQEKYGIRHLAFYDDQFTFNRQRVVDLCEKMIQNNCAVTFSCAVRAEHIDEPLLRLMRQAGCRTMSLGIETGDPELLARHRSNSDIAMLADRIKLIQNCRINVKGLMMMGLPGETEESIRRSREYLFSLPLNEFSMAKFTPFPGAPLYENAHQLGTFDEDWDRMDCMSFQFVPSGLERAQLESQFDLFYRRHFQRPRVWRHYLAMMWQSPDSTRRFLRNAKNFLKFASKR